MSVKPLRIAFYGKGGIGKSTIASNISALCAMEHKKVLHIGCDPKADSTRTLTGRRIPTVLELLEQKDVLTREDLLFEGKFGVQCVEAGGPEAGSGCAGLGITTAMDELQRAGIFEESWDVIIYDVLGDVVCGGFSVPMRKHFADKVYVVTSSNFMSLYAANNILKGINRYARGNSLFGGLILNHVNGETDLQIGMSFSEKTGARLLTWLEESKQMQLADFRRELLVHAFPDSANAKKLRNTVMEIQQNFSQNPIPMSWAEMEQFGEEIAERLCHESNNH